jgi:hypothetical protein
MFDLNNQLQTHQALAKQRQEEIRRQRLIEEAKRANKTRRQG